MPIYEYRCSVCGHQLEAIQKFSEPPLVKCPQCGAEGLTKLVSASAFQLKGTGWYVTDFRDKKKDTTKQGEKAPTEQGGGEGSQPKETAADKEGAPKKKESSETK